MRKLLVLMCTFSVFAASCSSRQYQTRDTVAGDSELLNYEYSNHFYSHELRKEHFFLNIELNQPAVIEFAEIDFGMVEIHAPITGSSLVRITVDRSGRVIRYNVLKYAGAGLDDYLEKVARASRFRPVEHREEPQECDFILKVVFRE
ncbi:MAG: energy transducer TonB [Spirochaetes bacterium]|jgi:hypothetical protein|nr:energy transducer TonB [Spirochaetota bacterium]